MEEEFRAKVIDGGRVTIPSYLRRKLGIKLGDEVKIKIWKEVRED